MKTAKHAAPRLEPVVRVLRVVGGGAGVEDASPCAASLTPPPRAARGREDEHLFILLDLIGPASPHLYRELREVMAQTYWSAAGSITAALRRAATAANGRLFHANLHSAPSDRCQGSLVSAVLHNEDLFVLQAGAGQAWFLRDGDLRRLARGEEPPPLGIGPLVDVRLHHTFVAPGDTLLLASRALIQRAGDTGLARVLPRAEMQLVLDGLGQIGAGVDFTALIVRWKQAAQAPASPEVPGLPPTVEREPVKTKESEAAPSGIKGSEAAPSGTKGSEAAPSRPRRRVRPKRTPKKGPSLGERMKRGIRSIGRGLAAAGGWLAGGVAALFRALLPGPQRAARRRARSSRPVPKENRAVMMAIAIGIPIVLAIIVILAYLTFGAESRIRGFIQQTEQEIALAQAAGDNVEEARVHWEAALSHATKATRLRPDDPVATVLQAQARAAIDLIDGIVRLQPVHLWDFGAGTARRQLVIHGQMAFVLDPAGGWVATVSLNPAGAVEQEEAPILVQTGQQVGGGEVGDLVGCAWVGSGGERQTSGLLVLEETGALISHDPAWVDEGGMPRVVRSFLGTSPRLPRDVDSFGGRLYILDADANQIWRYDPREDTYPEQPDRYFVTPPPKSLASALDMAIDGSIYVLYEDGQILQFLQGEHQPEFSVRGVPGDSVQAVAVAVDREGSSGALYVADAGDERVIVLGPDGDFQAQLRADEAFGALESLAVDEAAGRLYAISGGRLYVASLP